MSALQKKVINLIKGLSESKVAEVIDFIEYVKLKEELQATKDILDDPTLAKRIEKGLADIDTGNVVSLEELEDIENV